MRRVVALALAFALIEVQTFAQDQQRASVPAAERERDPKPDTSTAPRSASPPPRPSDGPPERLRPAQRKARPMEVEEVRRVRVRATVAVIDPKVGVTDIISQLRKTEGERRDLRAKQMATAVELRRVGREPAAGPARGRPVPVGSKPAGGPRRDKELRPHEGDHPRAGGLSLPDAQRMTGRERISERQGESRMRERLEKRRDMVNWRRSRTERGGPKEFREREGKR